MKRGPAPVLPRVKRGVTHRLCGRDLWVRTGDRGWRCQPCHAERSAKNARARSARTQRAFRDALRAVHPVCHEEGCTRPCDLYTTHDLTDALALEALRVRYGGVDATRAEMRSRLGWCLEHAEAREVDIHPTTRRNLLAHRAKAERTRAAYADSVRIVAAEERECSA